MKIRTKLTLLYVIITASILLVFASVVYYSASQNREKEFYSLLKKEAITKANLFFDAEVEPKTLQDIYRRNREVINEVEVAIYNADFYLLYHDALDIDFVKETRGMVDSVLLNGAIEFYQENWQVIGLRYNYEGIDYAITAAAYDDYGYTKLLNLRKTISMLFVISVIFIFLAGMIFSKRFFAPVRQMTHQVNNITIRNLGMRLQHKSNDDELSELAATFNRMLNRLEESFEAQNTFVSNISHELRTPLTAIITELELSANANRSVSEYMQVIENALSDAKRMNRLSNSLLDLAKASFDSYKIKFKPVRIDELIIDARQQVQKGNPDYHIDIRFEQDFEDENQIVVNGNEYLLKVAFSNLFENGCKFSGNNQSTLSVSFSEKLIILKFMDLGMGIPENEQQHIFTPFYRGTNSVHTEGNGIGLSLTKKIITLHKGSIHVESKLHKGTTFTVKLAHQ